MIASGWYPKEAHTAEARLRWYATQFSIVENDSTYYAIPATRQAELWVARTPRDFTMNVKAFATLTEHYTDPKRLPSDLRAALPAGFRDKAHVYPEDMGEELVTEIGRRFRDSIKPLQEAGRLGVVLYQYPVWFPASPANRKAVTRIRELFPDARVAVEFRNATWMSDKNRERTFSLLRDEDLTYTCVDEPQGFPSSIPPVVSATSDLALVRFHGRSASRWNRSAESARDRFRYRYSVDELREWVPRIRRLADQAAEVHVLMNNCYSDYAVVNAGQMRELLLESRLAEPRAAAQGAGRSRRELRGRRAVQHAP
ncbi:hypothetical protein AKJ09_05482 [Labilithrix luteola]|uniref:DUF72 domain-containing protein n=1 Tax=Labilithrix luteola TaxID=1391654 RepID=A0A0K1PZ71_9BACT|nr:hypothetical protein AKJ09_05482 [Labilithrix luteola]